MDGEGEAVEECQGQLVTNGPNGTEWTTTHYTSHQQIGNVVQIIVPDLSCMPQDQSGSLPSSINAMTTNGSLIVGHHTSKDPLAALAAAAELDQVRADCIDHIMEDGQQVEHLINRGVEHHMTGTVIDEGPTVEHIMETVDHSQQDLGHCSVNSETVITTINSGMQGMLPIAPFLKPDDPDVDFYNEIYHYITSGTFPPGCTEEYKKTIKRRASNYRLNQDGTMTHGLKTQKQVLANREEQYNIMEMNHVDPITGLHYGVKKMYSTIFSKYFWRFMYNDIGSYVRSCSKCTELDVGTGVTKAEANYEMEQRQYVSLPADRLMRVWKKVEVKIFGPYTKTRLGNEFLISMSDPFSHWIVTKPLTNQDIPYQAANFIFDSFCKFGFAQCQVIGMSSFMFEKMQAFYKEKFDVAQNILKTLVPFDCEDVQKSFMFTLQDDSHECVWAGELIEDICLNDSKNWDEEINLYIFEFCNSQITNGGPSPFSLMFARNPTGYISEEEKENINTMEEEKVLKGPSNRRRLRSSTLECRHCYETFTSKISFRIHQRKHTEEAQKRGRLEMEGNGSIRLPESKIKRGIGRRKRRILNISEEKLPTGWMNQKQPSQLASNLWNQITHRTVTAVKSLLNATKEERSRRGKYFKYSPELREEIAQYALDHSLPDACSYYSQKLGHQVNESSIRNFIRAHKSFSKVVKHEIGKHAYLHGVDRAAETYSDKLGCEVRKTMVKKCKKSYINEISGEEQSDTQSPKKTNVVKQKRSFSFQTRDEIGRYASQYGIPAAIQVFSEKLQFTVKESTVRKFRKQYFDRNATNIIPNNGCEVIQSNQVLTEHQSNDQTVDNLHSLSGLNTSSAQGTLINVSANNFVYQQPYALNVSTGATPPNQTVLPMNQNGITFQQTGVINQGMTTIPYHQQNSGTTSVIMNQNFAPQNQQTFQQNYVGNYAHPQGGQQQIVPISMSHGGSIVTSLSDSTSPLALTMATAPQHITLGHHGAVNETNQHHLANNNHQIVSTSFHQPLATNMSFDSAGNLQTQSTVSLNNEPLSLLKQTDQQQINDQNIPNTIIAVSNDTNINQPDTLSPEVLSQLNSTEQETQRDPEYMLGIVEDEDFDLKQEMSPPKKQRKCIKYRSGVAAHKRRNYVTYSPELRAEIGKYASEHGNLASINHFKEKLGLEIPESTVRGLKDKYIVKRMKEEKEVTSLGFAQRGRPMRLGQYDELVQQCMRELVKDGEKVSSFLAIATAKQVLMQYDPQSLEENGGPIKLNPTWAKSFLKRIGLSQV